MTYHTTTRRLIDTIRYIRKGPAAKVRTGDWTNPTWTATEVMRWFHRCLDQKINRNVKQAGRKHDDEYQAALRRDARIINDYFSRRIRQSGCRNLLAIPEMRRRYPQVNCQPMEA